MRKIPICGLFLSAFFLVLSLCASGAERYSGAASLSRLPVAAQASISAAMGRDIPIYSAKTTGEGFEAANARQKLVTRFTSEGVEVRHGNARWGLALRGYGYGNTLPSVKAVAPQSLRNRVEYRRGVLTEWYVNGPGGLEQGFTLGQPPEKANGQPLTIALAVSGNMSVKLDEDGTSVSLSEREDNAELSYTGLTATDATGKELQAWLEVQSEHLLLKVNDTGARYPVVIDPWVRLAQLTTSDAAAGDFLGHSAAMSGDTIVVGKPEFGGDTLGAVYVFIKPASGWADMTESAKLTASDVTRWLGYSVAISGDTIVAGAPDPNSSGAAYVFVKPASGWSNMTETAKLTVTNQTTYSFGSSVSLSGNTLVVGTCIDRGFCIDGAYVFLKPKSGWNTTSKYKARLTASDDMGSQPCFSCAVSILGNVVVAGAPEATVGSNNYRGAAYVFVKPASGWTDMTETAKLTASDGGAPGGLGYSVVLIGNTVVAGASGGQGAVCVFVKPATGWASMTETAKLTASDGRPEDLLGSSVATDGSRVVAGAYGAKGRLGTAYVFIKPATGWATTSKFNAKLRPPGTGRKEFGTSVAISGKTIVVGSPDSSFGSNKFQGAAYVFPFLMIGSFSPPSGPVGTPVTITGTSLAQTNEVTFGGVPSTDFTVDSDTQVTAVVPSGAVTGKVTIAIPGGKAVSRDVFTVTQ